MQALTLQQLFGVNVFEDSEKIVIKKTDLPGLTPSLTNTSESLLIGIVLKFLENFKSAITNEKGEAITDKNGNSLEFDNGDFVATLYVFRWDSIIAQRENGYVFRHTIVIHYYEINGSN